MVVDSEKRTDLYNKGKLLVHSLETLGMTDAAETLLQILQAEADDQAFYYYGQFRKWRDEYETMKSVKEDPGHESI